MDYDYILSEDFLFFLRLCRDPNQVFKPNSYESCLAQNWLDKLCCYECETLDDRRLRNIYISYLCVCLIEGKLKGPFKELPKPGNLQLVNFEEPVCRKKPTVTCPHLKSDPCADSAPCSQTTASQAQQPCGKIEMVCGDAKGPEEKSSAFNTSFNMGSFDSSPKTCEDDKSDKKANREDVMSLIASISSELCGKTGPDCDPYLESELCRYEQFIKDTPNLSCMLESQPSKEAMRSFLLLSLQNNLLKLMCDTNL